MSENKKLENVIGKIIASLSEKNINEEQQRPCIIRLKNDTPREWGAIIVGGAINFKYRSGSSVTIENTSLNLHSGQSYDFVEPHPEECVERVGVAFVVTVPDEGSQAFSTTHVVDENECLKFWEVRLAPKATTTLESTGMMSYLTLQS